MKYSKLILLFSITIILAGLLLTACDNRVVGPLDYTIASMTTDKDVIYSDNSETTYATIQVLIKDNDEYAVSGQEVQFRTDKGANIHALAGLTSFSDEAITENIRAIYESLLKLKPASAKGTYIKNISISSTMGPGVKVDTAEFKP